MFVLMSVIEFQNFFQSHDFGDYDHCNSVPGVKVIFHSSLEAWSMRSPDLRF